MNRKPVGAEVYDEKWIASAWGERANEAFLKQEIDHPRPRVKRALELAAIEAGQTVLDIACGRGEVPALAAEKGAFAVGVDFSAASLDFAAKVKSSRQERFKQGRMELVRADACRLPFANESFDCITMLDIVEHLTPTQLEAMFHEVGRLLKPGGFAVIHTLPNRWVYDVTFPLLHKVWRRMPADPRGPIDREIHINEQDLPNLHRLLKKCGLQHRLWLEQHMAAQARWNRLNDRFGDNRDQVYPLLTGLAGRILEAVSLTPAKLLLCNDIFGLAWKEASPVVGLKPRWGITERLAMRLLT
ncbi:MAG: class I SAM-dependent methyltransferase [Candidatus Competibacteraceae bacterium]|nr:class I SAM-dependent methyltransferase [Candidatus Competibacteraceae bacterium]